MLLASSGALPASWPSDAIQASVLQGALATALRLGYIAAEPGRLKPLLREKIYSVLITRASERSS
ncbi:MULTISPECIES: hypothetical protein [Sorangium]|uniref:hypothetical protein n=1 Tax=Sorangium TaxID=39643 RepID=UPI003D9C0A46